MRTFVKIFLIASIVWLQDVSPSTSLLMAIGFVLSVNFLSGRQLLEGFRIEQNTNVPGSCKNVKVSDLLKMFDNDEERLKKAMLSSNLPLSIGITEDNSPRIAAQLMNFGYNFGELCQVPMQ